MIAAEQILLQPALKYAALGAYLSMWILCLVQYAIVGVVQGRYIWIVPVTGIAACLLVLISDGRCIIKPFMLLTLAGFAIEFAGIHYGLFGDYSYTNFLGPAAVGVPIGMGLAWALLLCYVLQMLSPLQLSRYWLAVLGALWMTGIDLVIDPLATGPFKMWIWHGGGLYFGVPLSNFASWFVLSFILLAGMGRFRWTSRAVKLIGLSWLVSLALCAVRYQMWLPVVIGCMLCAAHWVVEHWHPSTRRLFVRPLYLRAERAG